MLLPTRQQMRSAVQVPVQVEVFARQGGYHDHPGEAELLGRWGGSTISEGEKIWFSQSSQNPLTLNQLNIWGTGTWKHFSAIHMRLSAMYSCVGGPPVTSPGMMVAGEHPALARHQLWLEASVLFLGGHRCSTDMAMTVDTICSPFCSSEVDLTRSRFSLRISRLKSCDDF